MIRISEKQLRGMNACETGITWFKGQSARTLKRIVPALMKDGQAGYALWLLPRLMTHPQKVKFAIYAAEQVLEIYERERPDDDRPRKAIQAAKDFLAGKIDANAAAYAAYAANAAAYADANAAAYAANAAANAAAYADANAAYAAANAAYAANAAAYAANAAAYAANAAAYAAANAAYAANAARSAMQKRIAHYGLVILGEAK